MSEASSQAQSPIVCRIFIDGEELSDFYPYLIEASVELGREVAGICTLQFDTLRDEEGKWLIQDNSLFRPWKPIVIKAALGESEEEVMRGYIREVSADYPRNMGEAKAVVLAQDESLLLERRHMRRRWSSTEEPVSDGDIVRQLGGEYGFNVQAEDGLKNAGLYQDSTDIRFLRERAVANGFELLLAAGEMRFSPSRLDAEPQPTINVYAGEGGSCSRISVTHDGYLPDRIAVSRAAQTGSETESESFAPDLPLLGKEEAGSEGMGLSEFSWFLRQPSGHSEQEALSRAQAKANEMSMKVRAEGELDGTLYGRVLRVAEPVGVDGIGETYSGHYYVDAVTHLFSADGYRQRFVLLRNATGSDLPAASDDKLAALR